MNRDMVYARASRQFITKAFEELYEGDVVQASQKGWGAAAQIIKAVAEQRGWRHNSHPSLSRIIDRLVEETGDAQLFNLYQVANGLHFNFYEDLQSAGMVELGLRDIQTLVEKLEPLLE